MIKLIFAVAMQEADRERLRRYIPEKHSPLVVSVAAAIKPMYRYIPHLSIKGKEDKAFGLPVREEFFAVMEMLHESVEAMVASRSDEEFKEKILADEQQNMKADFNQTFVHFVKEIKVVSGPAWPITLYHFLKRRDGLGREEFQARWQEAQSAIIGSGGPQECIRHYVQNHILPAGSFPMGTDDAGFDIIDEYHFETLEDMAEFRTQNPEKVRKSAEERAKLTDPDRSFAVLSQGITFIERVAFAG